MKFWLFALAVVAAAGLHADVVTRFIVDTMQKGEAQFEAVKGDGLVTFKLTYSQPDNPNRQWAVFNVTPEARTYVAEFKAVSDCRLRLLIDLNKDVTNSVAVTSLKVNGREMLNFDKINLKTGLPVGAYGAKELLVTGADGAKYLKIFANKPLLTGINLKAGQTYRLEAVMAEEPSK